MSKIYTQEIAEHLTKTLIGVKAAGEGGTFEVIASTQDIDRHGEMIKQDGWKLENYMKNPVILTDHLYRVENICGKATGVKIENDKMIISWEFAPGELGQEVRALYEAGFLNTVSVGFICLARDPNNQDMITSAELLELSFVAIPANPEALALAKSLWLKGEMLVKSAELEAIEELAKSVAIIDEKIGRIEAFLVDGKTTSDAQMEQKELVQSAARALNEALRGFKTRRA